MTIVQRLAGRFSLYLSEISISADPLRPVFAPSRWVFARDHGVVTVPLVQEPRDLEKDLPSAVQGPIYEVVR